MVPLEAAISILFTTCGYRFLAPSMSPFSNDFSNFFIMVLTLDIIILFLRVLAFTALALFMDDLMIAKPITSFCAIQR